MSDFNILIILILGSILFIWFVFLARRISLSKKMGQFAMEPVKEDRLSLSDYIFHTYIKFRTYFSTILRKIRIFDKYSTKYSKYSIYDTTKHEDMDYITDKLVVGILFLFLIVLSSLLRGRSLTSIWLLYGFLIGFFIPDLYLILKKLIRKKQVEEDLFQAVIIMNHAFKAGRSTMQVIKIVMEELDGIVGEEFKRMYQDLSYGLSLDVVFSRFSSRIHSEQANYITTSLIILNKTGGNIVTVFSSIERNFINKKKLDQELKSLTASASFVFKVLVSMPIFLFLIIFLLNPTYFNPLIQTQIGLLILGLIISIYLVYILIVRRIMRWEDSK